MALARTNKGRSCVHFSSHWLGVYKSQLSAMPKAYFFLLVYLFCCLVHIRCLPSPTYAPPQHRRFAIWQKKHFFKNSHFDLGRRAVSIFFVAVATSIFFSVTKNGDRKFFLPVGPYRQKKSGPSLYWSPPLVLLCLTTRKSLHLNIFSKKVKKKIPTASYLLFTVSYFFRLFVCLFVVVLFVCFSLK